MTYTAPAPDQPRHAPWDAVIVALLGAALFAAGWLDVRSYLVHRGHIQPDFRFLDREPDLRAGEREFYRGPDTLVMLENVGGAERINTHAVRHSLGPRGAIFIWTRSSHASLDMTYYNGVDDQDMTITCNGRVIEHFSHLDKSLIARTYPLDLQPGRNEIDLIFARYNHGGIELAADDLRPIAGDFKVFDLNLQ